MEDAVTIFLYFLMGWITLATVVVIVVAYLRNRSYEEFRKRVVSRFREAEKVMKK